MTIEKNAVSVSIQSYHGEGVDGGVVLLDEELHQLGVPVHGRVVQAGPANLELTFFKSYSL